MNGALQRTIAAAALVVLSPVLLILGILVRLRLGRPVFFLQERGGYKGRPFRIVKFRTLTVSSLPDEERLTAFGQWLRRTSLDELPELWNVVRGDMNLVGPRPLLLKYLPLYNPEEARRHEVKPGITGWAQVNGRNSTTWARRLELDGFYVKNRSLGLDLQILWKTPFTLLSREGVNAPGDAMMEEFRGSEGLGR